MPREPSALELPSFPLKIAERGPAGATGAVVLAALLNATAFAQNYPTPAGPPHTTDVRVLRREAVAREVHERFRRGLAAEDRADWGAAIPEFERIIALDPPEPKASTARYDLAVAHAHRAEYGAARDLLEEALQRDPGFAAAAANLLTVDALAGDLPRARAAADRFIELVPASARAHYDRGIVALRSGDLTTARRDLAALISGDPQYAVARYDLALVDIRSDRLDDAEVELGRALALAPGYAQARFALGTVYLRTARRAQARDAFDRVVRDATDPMLGRLARDLRDRL